MPGRRQQVLQVMPVPQILPPTAMTLQLIPGCHPAKPKQLALSHVQLSLDQLIPVHAEKVILGSISLTPAATIHSATPARIPAQAIPGYSKPQWIAEYQTQLTLLPVLLHQVHQAMLAPPASHLVTKPVQIQAVQLHPVLL